MVIKLIYCSQEVIMLYTMPCRPWEPGIMAEKDSPLGLILGFEMPG
jgi:hypothetical protein